MNDFLNNTNLYQFSFTENRELSVFETKSNEIVVPKILNCKDGTAKWRITKEKAYRYFTQKDIDGYLLRKQIAEKPIETLQFRNNVEATIFQLGYHYPTAKSRYRGEIKHQMWVNIRCLWVNFVRILKYIKQLCQRTLFFAKYAVKSTLVDLYFATKSFLTAILPINLSRSENKQFSTTCEKWGYRSGFKVSYYKIGMTQEELFSQALHVQAYWFIKEMKFDLEQGQLDILIDFERGSIFDYQDNDTGASGKFKAYDICEKTWRHLIFFKYKWLHHAFIPRINIGNGKVRQVIAPWEGKSSGFTLLFESFALQLVTLYPVHQVAGLFSSYDQKLWNSMHVYIEECLESEDFSKVERIGVDKTAACRGHDYLSLFVDLDQKKIIFVTEGKGSGTVDEFAKDLVAYNGKQEQLTEVSCDMSPAFIKGVTDHLPEAQIVFDRFHLLKVVNDTVDKVRKEEAKTNPLLKSSRYVFLKNRENYTAKQKQTFESLSISGLNLITMRAHRMKEAFQQIDNAVNPEQFLKLLGKWYYWAAHSRLEPFIEAAKTIKRHWYVVKNWAYFKIDNGILEGFNSIFQSAKSKARGCRSTAIIKTVTYILTGKLDFAKINPACAIHSLL